MKSKQDKKALVKPTKGFLNEIRTKENELVGYLFGTQHKLGINELEHLHPRVLSCFDNASHVFFELENPFPNNDNSKPPTGIEHFLYRRGISQKKEFGGLETELSRKEIAKKLMIDEEYSYYNVKIEGLLVIIFHQKILAKYNQLAALSNKIENIEDISALVVGILEVMPLIVYIIENQKFFTRKLDDKLFTIIDEITQLILALKIIPGIQSNFLKEKLLAQREQDEKHFFDTNEEQFNEFTRKYLEGNEEQFNEFTRKYLEGDDSTVDQSIPKAPQNVEFSLKKYKDEMLIKELQERDAVMAETIHNDLRMTLLTKENRCGFYAPGAFHVIGNYPNSLPNLLKQKGWILNKVELPSVLPLEEKSSLNNVQLVLSLNRFFSIDDERLKSGMLLEDRTRADPYGPGAIVLYTSP